jgi:beta-glucosidase
MSHLNLNIYKYIVGIDEVNNTTLSLEDALVVNQRIEYYYSHLRYLWRAIK